MSVEVIGGLDMAVGRVFNAEMLWCSEIDRHAGRVLAQRFPWAENYADITDIEWDSMPRVDILTGGYPCQPFSGAGLKRGENDERHLWPAIREAIRVLQPAVSVFENVSGHRTRGLGTVLRDGAEDGLDVRWGYERASAPVPHKGGSGCSSLFRTAGPGL